MVQKCIMGSSPIGGGTATVLMDTKNVASDGTVLSLTDDITNYNCIEIQTAWYAVSEAGDHPCHISSHFISKDAIKTAMDNYVGGTTYVQGGIDISRWANDSFAMFWVLQVNPSNKNQIIAAKKTVKTWAANTCYIWKIIGYK